MCGKNMKLQNLNYGIVGLGIMGGSFAKSIRENILSMAESNGKIFACNRSQACIQQALSEGVIDEGFSTENVSEMVKKCDVIFICLYPHATLDFLVQHKENFKSGSIVTDISGVKGIFEKSLPEILRPDVDFIIGHPMAGGEKEGYVNSKAEFFVNHNYILIPQTYNKPENLETMRALITDMDEPLGTHIGNTLEIKEVIATLNGGGAEDLRTLCLSLAANIIALAENIEKESALRLAREALQSGKALEKFKQMVAAQGGDVRYIENPALFEEAAFAHPIAAPQSGYIQKTDAQRIGETAALLGAGRQKMEDSIDFAAGIILEKKCGAYVTKGDTVATLYTNQKESLAPAAERFQSALTIGKTSPQKPPLIQGEVL